MPRTWAADRLLVVLDYDGTLCATREAIVDAIVRVFDVQGVARPEDAQIASAVGTGAALPDVVRLMHPAGQALTDDEVMCWTREYRRLYAEHSAARVCAFPGVRETLERLASQVDLVVMSNKGAAAVDDSLEALGLRRFIAAVIADKNGEVRKPDARVFTERIVQQFDGARPERTLVVGDTEVDLLFAKNAGLLSCWAEYGYGCPIRCGEVGFDFRIATFPDVARVVEDAFSCRRSTSLQSPDSLPAAKETTMRYTFTTLIAATLTAIIGSSLLFAEVPSRSPERLAESATHIVTGKVMRVYSRQQREGPTNRTRYIAEVRIEAIEKGVGLEPDSLIYVRYLTQVMPRGTVGTAGHRGLPKEGERVRIYLAQNASDGFEHDNDDGGFNVLFPNGFEPLPAKQESMGEE